MSLQRISNISLFNSTMRNVMKTQTSLFNTQDQISSGLISRDFKGLNGKVEQFVGLEVKIAKIDIYIENNAVTKSRLNTATQAMRSIIDEADTIEDLMVAARNPATAKNLDFTQQVTNKLQAVADSMNITFEGRFLFSGIATNQKPVPTVPVGNAVLGVPDDSYYAGAKQSTQARVDDDVPLDFPVRGDDESFQELFAAVNLAIHAYETKNDDGMKRALTLMQSAQEKLNTAQGRIASSTLYLEQVAGRQTQLKLYWQSVVDEVSKTDVVAATSKVAADQAVLQASYQVFARLVQLKLSDFL